MAHNLLSIAALALSLSPPGDTPCGRLQALFEARFRWRLQEHPEEAMARGDYANAGRLTDHSLEAIEARHRRTLEHLRALQAIDRRQLPPQERLNYDLFELELHNAIEDHRFRAHLIPIGRRFGPVVDVPQMHERVRFEHASDYEDYLRRLQQVPQWIDDTIACMTAGMQQGWVPPRVCLQGIAPQFEALAAGGLRGLGTPFASMPGMSPERGAAWRQLFESQVLPDVAASLDKLGRFFNDHYLPACRESIAAIELPGGAAFYAHQLRKFTTTPLTAEDIHALGLDEVSRIRAEMIRVIRRSDFMDLHAAADGLDDDTLFKEFIAYLRTDSRFYHGSAAELLSGYRDICKRVDAWLPKFFRTLPRLPYGVRAIPAFMAPSQTTAYYSHGDIRNAEPGYFYANTHALNQRPTYEMIALAMHEAVPGHHLQIALAQELPDVPEFRRMAYFTAFGEGWALYAERLGIEMGLYSDPYDDFGRLLYEMWRACRLVVDPGMHALGWSRERAVQYLLDHTALSPLNVNTEIDRYIAWPGQATAYKIGELKIRELRRQAEQRLGAHFDIREFHEVILGGGTLPLTLLERRVQAWLQHTQSTTSSRP